MGCGPLAAAQARKNETGLAQFGLSLFFVPFVFSETKSELHNFWNMKPKGVKTISIVL